MPTRPKRPCSYPGCPNLTDGQYCEQHRKEARQKYDKYERSRMSTRPTAERGNESVTATQRSTPARCVLRKQTHSVQEVHHILPISQLRTTEVIMSLCQSCHTKIHHDIGDR